MAQHNKSMKHGRHVAHDIMHDLRELAQAIENSVGRRILPTGHTASFIITGNPREGPRRLGQTTRKRRAISQQIIA